MRQAYVYDGCVNEMAIATLTAKSQFHTSRTHPNYIYDAHKDLPRNLYKYSEVLPDRFLSIDPVGFASTGNPAHFNRYAYANNDPVNMIDPDGNVAITAGVDIDVSVAGFGVGVQGKLAVSLSKNPSGGFTFQRGVVGTVTSGMNNIAFQDPNSSIGDKALGLAKGLVTDTGASALVEGGAFVGTDANPADVSDLGGTSGEIGVQVSKKALTKMLPGNLGKAANFAPAPELSGQAVFGENGIKGIELGGGVGAGNPLTQGQVGSSTDAQISKAIVLDEKRFGQ